MKNLKSYEDHMRLLHDIEGGKARVITYGMTDTNHALLAKDFLSAENVVANFDSNKNKWGQKLSMGVTTMPLDAITEMSKKADGIIIMADAVFQIGAYLETLGLSYCHGRLMNEKLPPRFIERARIEKNKVAENADKLNKVRSLLADSRSQIVYDSLITARTTDNPHELYLSLCEIISDDQYFPKFVPSFLPLKDEIFVDGGAYYGDTIQALRKLGEEKRVYKHIYAFEPDPINFEILCQYVSDDPDITCYKKGLYSKDTFVEFFSDTVSYRSKIKEFVREDRIFNNTYFSQWLSPGESIKIEACSIDNLIKDRVTFIKMDLEGSEPVALKGAENTIRLNKPKLAICIYHNIEDFWEIPLYIKEIVPEYKLYLGHHGIGFCCLETVLYALI